MFYLLHYYYYYFTVFSSVLSLCSLRLCTFHFSCQWPLFTKSLVQWPFLPIRRYASRWWQMSWLIEHVLIELVLIELNPHHWILYATDSTEQTTRPLLPDLASCLPRECGMICCLKGCLSGLLTEVFNMQSQNTLTMPHLLCTFLLIKTGKGAQSAGVQLHFPRLAAWGTMLLMFTTMKRDIMWQVILWFD